MNTLLPSTRLEEQLVIHANRTYTPISGAFELLPLCNLKCRMCYLRLSSEECRNRGGLRTVSQWVSLAEELKEAGSLFLLLSGGEPFLYPGFFELYEKLKKMGFILTINTNGTLIGENEAEFLADNMPRRVNITLYGTCRETYKKVTGSADAFDKTILGIKNLTARNIPVKMNVSLIPENIDELEAFYHLADQLQIPLEVNEYMFPAEREEDIHYEKNVRMTPERAAEAMVLNRRLQMSHEEFKAYAKQAAKDLHNTEDTECGASEKECIPCRAGRSSFWVNWKGELSPCVFLGNGRLPLKCFVTDDVLQKKGTCYSFTDAWSHITKVRDMLYLPSACVHCRKRKYCQICGAAAQAENKEMSIKPDYLCRMTTRFMELMASEE